jgi:lipopolysaccharide export system protein LptA
VRLTIERIRTLVLGAGLLLILAIAAFLVFDKWKNRLIHHDIPQRLGIEIQQEANGVTYTQAHGGNTIFKIHASRVVQLRNQHATLHDVEIELYGQHGRRVDTIRGDEFDYDQKTGIASASGPVEISMQSPAAAAAPGTATAKAKAADLIRVHTSGLVFEQKTGIATTSKRVDFSTGQGSGSSMGASFDSDHGLLVLDHDVQLTALPKSGNAAQTVQVHASHAEFERDAQLCRLTEVSAETRAETASAARAVIYFRDDGSVQRMNAEGGFTLATSTGSRVGAPAAQMEFDQKNQPSSGHLSGGVTVASETPDRTVSGSAPRMDLAFAAGNLRHAHLEQGVEFHSQERSEAVSGGRSVPVVLTRTWHSRVADIDFRATAPGKVEPAVMHGSGGVVLTGESRRGSEAPVPSRLAADELTGSFGSQAALRSIMGVGNASLQQTAANGTVQSASADRLQARFAPVSAAPAAHAQTATSAATQVQAADLDGHVVLVSQPAAKPGAQQEAPLRVSAGHAAYEGAGELLHLTVNPRVNEGGMELTADTLDVAEQSGDAFAHGNIKATWLQSAGSAPGGVSFGGRGPAHAIASEAELHRATNQATFRGRARLWQDDNSISAPLLILDRETQTLLARTTSAGSPVTAVLLSAGTQGAPRSSAAGGGSAVIRVRGGELYYSSADRKAIFRSSPLAAVTAQSGAVTSTSDEVELLLAAAGARGPASAAAAPAQVERMTALGHVVLSAQGRRGTGHQLTYTGKTGDYVLTGTASSPPILNDPERGSVTGEALIFHSRDDSVSIEGGQQETTTRTTAPR